MQLFFSKYPTRNHLSADMFWQRTRHHVAPLPSREMLERQIGTIAVNSPEHPSSDEMLSTSTRVGYAVGLKTTPELHNELSYSTLRSNDNLSFFLGAWSQHDRHAWRIHRAHLGNESWSQAAPHCCTEQTWNLRHQGFHTYTNYVGKSLIHSSNP